MDIELIQIIFMGLFDIVSLISDIVVLFNLVDDFYFLNKYQKYSINAKQKQIYFSLDLFLMF